MSRISRRVLASVTLLMVLIVLALALVTGYVVRTQLFASLEDDMARQGRQMAAILADAAGADARLASDPAALAALMRETGTASEVHFTVIAQDGRVLADSAEDPSQMENHATRPEVVVALAGGEGRSRRFSATLGEEAIYVAVPIQSPPAPWAGGVMRVSAGNARVDPLLRHIWWLPLATGAVALIPALTAAYLLSRSLTRPIERLRKMALKVSGGDLTYRVATPRRTDELGELARALNQMAHDLEQRVHELTDERTRMADILGSMDDGVLVVDADGVVTAVNPAAAAMLGARVEELTGEPLVLTARVFPARPLVDEALQSGRAYTRTLELPGDRTLEALVTPLEQSGRGTPKVLMVLHDVTERTRVDRIRKDFVANVSHELKTPLAGISLLAATLQNAVHDDPEGARGFAERLNGEIQRLTDLVQDLLALSILDDGRSFKGERAERIDLTRIAEQVVEDQRSRAEQRGIELSLRGPEAAVVVGDEVALATLVRNLVDNALRYTEPDGHVHLKVDHDSREVRITVRDDGIGIPRDDRDRIFERFYRVDKARSRDTGGTGLGLSIVKNVAAVHGGTVEVESAVGVGSTFTVRLPAAPPPTGAAP
ncbi:MAG: HAMP domain-containing sensor histidine kinase [Thermoleophilia bacterium]